MAENKILIDKETGIAREYSIRIKCIYLESSKECLVFNDSEWHFREILKNGEMASIIWYELINKENPKVIKEINSKFVSEIEYERILVKESKEEDIPF